MDRVHLLLLGLPLFLFCTDLVSIFTPPPPGPPHHHHHHHHQQHQHQHPPHRHHHHHHQSGQYQQPPPVASETLEFPTQNPDLVEGIGLGNTVDINFCASCSYRGTAVTMKKMLETSFPGIDVVLANYPPPLPKRVLGKLVPVVQIGVIGIVMAGEQIFPMLGVMTPPWYYSLRANRFGTITTTWLLGNFFQSFLQSSGAFEVYCNDEMVFSKLREGRFPGEIELKDLISKKLATSRITNGLGD
ncbi:selT-like protein [Malania oleifera]|uniref:selT-like protein n=1 Tax=Malania oleifera TaxID=397392 RepID=UPI0025AE9002|nr:selT-like protein [Malania oleifera]